MPSLITIKNMSHSLGGKIVLENINIALEEATVTGLVGINGAGKTTLMRLISGVYVQDKGEIRFGEDPVDLPSVKEQIFFLPDDPYYNHRTTGNELFSMYKQFYPSADRKVFDDTLELFGLSPKERLRSFSKGMRRQMFVAIALAIKPKLLLLDESFDGLDPKARLSFKKAVNVFVEENDTTVLIASHSLRELEDFCDSYIMIDNRTVSSSGDITDDVSKYCKYQLAFSEPIGEEAFENMPAVSLSLNGKFVTVILEADEKEAEEMLLTLSPVIMDKMTMDFEEMFICEAEKKGKEKK